MKLSFFLTCVNYSDYLEETLKYNHKIFDEIFISTSPNDEETKNVCSKYKNIHVEITDSFFENDAPFNKGKGLNKILKYIKPNQWIIIGDADCIFPDNIRYEIDKIISKDLQNDLFSYYRTKVMTKSELDDILNYNKQELQISFGNVGIGYCQIFNSSSKFVKNPIKYSESFDNAAWPDFEFSLQWPSKNKHLLNGIVYHLGECIENWRGRITDSWNKKLENTKWIDKIDKKYDNIRIDNYKEIPAFVINLEERPDRLSLVDEQFENIKWPVKRWPAIKYKKSPHSLLSPSVAGCLDSHKKIWRHIIEKQYPFAAVFEDDVIFTSDFEKIYKSASKELPKNWDVWHFHATKAQNKPCKSHVLINKHVVKIRSLMWGSHAYLISNQGCKKALNLPNNVPVDWALSGSLISKDAGIFGIRTSSSIAFQRGNQDSDISNCIVDFWQKQKEKFYR